MNFRRLSSIGIHPSQFIRMLDIRNRALQCTSQIDVEEWSVQSMHNGDLLRRNPRVRLATRDLLVQVIVMA